jgi:hypothetical protein
MAARYLYVIGSPDLPDTYKIGIAANPANRCRDLQTGTPLELRVLHSLEVEDALAIEAVVHSLLEAARIRGEWFKIGFEAALSAIGDALSGVRPATPAAIGGCTAPPGECEYCDRRRAVDAARLKRHREKKDG